MLLTSFQFQGIRVVHKFSIKEQKSTVIGVAWFENKIYICDGKGRIFIVPDKAPFNETLAEITFNKVIDPTDMVVCKVNRCNTMYISDGWGKCVYEIKLTNNPNYSSTRLEFIMGGMPQRMSVTPSAQLLSLVKSCCVDSWYIAETDSDNVTFRHLFDIPLHIHAVEHAVKVPSGNVIVSYETRRSNTSRYLIGEMSVPGRRFLWRIDIRSTALPRLQKWFSSQLFVREDGEIFLAGVSDNGRSYRNHVFRLTTVDKELDELVCTIQDRDHPMRFSLGQDDTQSGHLSYGRVPYSLLYF